MPHDARGIANLILDRAEFLDVDITNLSLNKIIYFVNGMNYQFSDQDLIEDDFEAWDYGPVVKEVYYQFKKHNNQKITSRATYTDFNIGKTAILQPQITREEMARIMPLVDFFSRVPPGKLVDWSHIEGSPWYNAWNHAGRLNLGMKIRRDSMRTYFKDSWSKVGARIG